MTVEPFDKKLAERTLLLRKIFDGLAILFIGRELQDTYCMQYNEIGYDKDYRYYDEKTAAASVSGAVPDDNRLVTIVQKHRDRLRTYWSFFGEFYTYDPKKKELLTESAWSRIEQKLDSVFSKHGVATSAVLKAYIELRNDNDLFSACDYSRLAYRAKELGGKGWKQALVALEIDGVIEKRGSGRRPGERSISLELIPLVEQVLSKWEKRQPTTTPLSDRISGSGTAEAQRGTLFLSHSNVDSEFALKLGTDLEKGGIRVWIYEAEMMIGDSLIEKISKAIDETDYLGVVLSQSSVKSEWVKKEVNIAMTQEIQGKRVKVLPLLLDNCEVPAYLQDKVYADFRNPSNYERELRKIVKRVTRRSLSEHIGLAKAGKSQVTRGIERSYTVLNSTRIGIGLTAYAIANLVGFTSALLWVFDPYQALQRGITTGLLAGGVIWLVAYQRGATLQDAAIWCRQKLWVFLFASMSFLICAVMLQLSISLYPSLSGLYFETHLRDAPLVSIYLLIAVIVGGFVLNLPTILLREMRPEVISWILRHRKTVYKAILAFVLVGLASTAVAPLDSFLVLGTPKAGLVESGHVIDETIYIYQIGLTQFGANIKNQETIHLLSPLILLVHQVRYPLASNSTRESTVLYEDGVSTRLVSAESGRLVGLELSINQNTATNSVTSVSYWTELSVSSVAAITLSPERTVEALSNGTRRVQQTFQVLNLSPYRLNIGFTRLFYSTGYFEEAANVTRGRADVWYDKDSHWICLVGELLEGGSVTITVLYNTVS